MVVGGHRDDLLGLVLAHHVLVELGLELVGQGDGRHEGLVGVALGALGLAVAEDAAQRDAAAVAAASEDADVAEGGREEAALGALALVAATFRLAVLVDGLALDDLELAGAACGVLLRGGRGRLLLLGSGFLLHVLAEGFRGLRGLGGLLLLGGGAACGLLTKAHHPLEHRGVEVVEELGHARDLAVEALGAEGGVGREVHGGAGRVDDLAAHAAARDAGVGVGHGVPLVVVCR